MARWGLIGTDLSAAATAMALEVAGERLVALASHRPGAIDGLADQTGARVVGVDAIGAAVDVVGVLGPLRTRTTDVLRAVAGGATVVVGAPVASRIDDLARLERVVAAGGRIVHGEHLLHGDAFAIASTHIADIGDLTNLTIRSLDREPRLDLLDVGLARAAAFACRIASGAATSVAATLAGDRASAQVSFAGGQTASIEVQRRAHATVVDVQAASATGVVVAHLEPDPSVERNGDAVALPIVLDDDHPRALDVLGHVGLVRHVARVHAGRATDASFAVAAATVRIAAAARVASDTGTLADLPLA